jgi:hypothetical protein
LPLGVQEMVNVIEEMSLNNPIIKLSINSDLLVIWPCQQEYIPGVGQVLKLAIT